jgi:glyoxylase-like metal-dependent hydrolase (beta-lactamase superfamily II)
MQFGPFDIACIETGLFRLDGGAMFGVVPRNLWERTNPPDESNRINMAMRSLLVRGGSRTILVDTGVGDKLGEKLRSIYHIDQGEFNLLDGLAAQGVHPDQITDVILTHLHFDHAGGSVKRAEDGALLPVFPNARHYVQKSHWEWAMHPSDRDKASFLPENYMPLREHGLLDILDGNMELFPGISLELMNGHTFGQQLLRVSDDRRAIVFCGDLIPMSAHVPAPYIMGYDLQPLVTLSEKTAFLQRAAAQSDILLFEHDPPVQSGIVLKDERGYRLAHAGSLVDLVAMQQSMLSR